MGIDRCVSQQDEIVCMNRSSSVTRPTVLEGIFPALVQEGLGVIDVGCRDGMQTIFKEVAPLISLVGFEPEPEEGKRLQREPVSTFQSASYLPYALGGVEGPRALHLCRSAGASSFYRPNRDFLNRFMDPMRFDTMTTVTVPVRTLDGLVADSSVSLPRHIDFLKVDTQGSELEILRGAEQTLRQQVLAVEVEVEFAQLYADQPVFRDVDAFLSQCGFQLFKLRRQEWVRRPYATRPHLTAGQLVFGDALYLRDPLSGVGSWSLDSARQAEALVLLATLYDLYDFALELLAWPTVSSLLDAQHLRAWIIKRSRKLGSFFERLRVVKAALSGSQRFRRYPACYARGDENFYSVLR